MSTIKSALSNHWTRIHAWGQRYKWWRIETALLAGAIALGCISSALSKIHDQRNESRIAATYATVSTIVTKRNLGSGETIQQSDLRVISSLRATVNDNHITPKNLSLVLGKKTSIDLKKGDPILLTAVQGASAISGMAERIPPGKRLFTLQIKDQAAGYGFIKPNDHVDVLAHIKMPGRGTTTFTVLHDVTLVSVGSSTNSIDSSESGSAVSFFVDAKDSEMLAFAQRQGDFSLALRNPKDIERVSSANGIDLNRFLDYESIYKVSGGGNLQITEKGRHVNKGKKQ